MLVDISIDNDLTLLCDHNLICLERGSISKKFVVGF